MDNQFKIYLGIELEKGAKNTLSQEIAKLNKNGVKLKVGLDEESLKTLTSSIDTITAQLQKMGSISKNATKGADRAFEQSTRKAKDYADGLDILTEQYKKGTLSAKEYFDAMNGRMLNKNGELNAYNKQVDPTKLQEYLNLLSSIQSRIGEIKPIGDLVSTKEVSSVSNGFTELIQKVDTYTDRMGRTQAITSIIDSETKQLVASYQTITDKSEKYSTSIEKQKTSMENLKNGVNEVIGFYNNMIRSGNTKASDNAFITQANQLKKEYNEINSLNEKGVLIEQSKLEAFKRNLSEQQNIIKSRALELEQARQLKVAQESQSLYIQKQQEKLNNQNTKYSTGVNEADKQAMQQMINDLGKLNPLQDDYKNKVSACEQALNSYLNKVKESATQSQKQEVALNKQIETIHKLQTSFANTNTKYSTGIKESDTKAMDKMLDDLSRMNPMTEEYRHQLKMVGIALSEYGNKAKANATQTQKEEVALNNQINALEKLRIKLENIKNSTKGSYNKQQANNFSQEIEAISRLNPLTEEYRSRVQAIGTAMAQFGVESKNAFAQSKGELTNYEKGLERLLLLFKTGSISDQQFLKSAQSMRYLTNSTGELVEKQEYLNLSSQKVVQLHNAVSTAQKRVQTENEKTKKSQEDLALYQEKMIFNLKQLKTLYASKGMDTSSIDVMISKVRGLTTDTDRLKNEQNKLNEAYRQMKASATGIDSVGTSLKRVLQLATGFYGIQSVFMYMRQAISSIVSEIGALDNAMVGLSRVTNETDQTYANFKNTMFEVADKIGGTATELVESTTEFAKLGYSFEESGKLAESASKYATVGWLDMKDATDSLSASYTVFGGTFDNVIGKVVDSTTIIDLYNKIGNTMAVTSGDIGIAMKDSANSLASANNSISESVALVATANKTIQDSSKVGNALRTISMRLRGKIMPLSMVTY